jgi:hypothetical protein
LVSKCRPSEFRQNIKKIENPKIVKRETNQSDEGFTMAAFDSSTGPLHQGWMHKQGNFFLVLCLVHYVFLLIVFLVLMFYFIQGHIIRNWKNRFFILQMANEGSRKCFRLLYYKEQNNYEVKIIFSLLLVFGVRCFLFSLSYLSFGIQAPSSSLPLNLFLCTHEQELLFYC